MNMSNHHQDSRPPPAARSATENEGVPAKATISVTENEGFPAKATISVTENHRERMKEDD